MLNVIWLGMSVFSLWLFVLVSCCCDVVLCLMIVFVSVSFSVSGCASRGYESSSQDQVRDQRRRGETKEDKKRQEEEQRYNNNKGRPHSSTTTTFESTQQSRNKHTRNTEGGHGCTLAPPLVYSCSRDGNKT